MSFTMLKSRSRPYEHASTSPWWGWVASSQMCCREWALKGDPSGRGTVAVLWIQGRPSRENRCTARWNGQWGPVEPLVFD